jgi:16S rRNA pseudouridine516 synthase
MNTPTDKGIHMKLRIHQFLSKCGEFSSKEEVKQAIWSGDVTVNDSIVKHIAYEFNPAKRAVKYRGKELFLPSNDVYFLLNKPSGCICSRLNSQELEHHKVSVYEIFRDAVEPSIYESLVTVGRLDEETTGLLLVTTDGKLVHSVTDPNKNIKKTYRVKTKEVITEAQLESIREGVEVSVTEYGSLEEFLTRPATIELESATCAVLTIDEGKKRQIRRMFTTLGNHVNHLHRLSTEGMVLKEYGLELGQFCTITQEEINRALFS